MTDEQELWRMALLTSAFIAAVASAFIAAVASLIVAIISGVVATQNRRKTEINSQEIQYLRGAVDSDLEKLKAKLSHGQTVSSTQWKAEFRAYQHIWRAVVPV